MVAMGRLMMLPKQLIHGIHAVRDEWTFDKTCELFIRAFAPDGRGGQQMTLVSAGEFHCRLDAMESGVPNGELADLTKRDFGLTLGADAPRLELGARCVVDGVEYTVDGAHDCASEQIIRRYVVSVPESAWISAPQPESVRDDNWEVPE